MYTVTGMAATEAKGPLEPFTYDLPEIGPEQVDIAVDYCGICHSDVAVINNEWGMSRYPVVPGHEIVGRVIRAGDAVKRVAIGDRVGLGWFSGSCMACRPCLTGDHNMCVTAEQTIVGRHGGFADTVRTHWVWATPLPDEINHAAAGPLFCGGITVFNPIVQAGLVATDRVGVIGIGGLGHLALQFLSAWGCEVTAFTTNAEKKADEARAFGADHVVDTNDVATLKKLAGSFDFILSTVAVSIEWMSYIGALAPRGRFHLVGVPDAPLSIVAFPLIGRQLSVTGSALGSPATTSDMIEFCVRKDISPMVEHFPMSDINAAIAHMEEGRPRFRVVLDNDLV